ncbi:MAG TPA: acyl-CoA thioesterase II [Acidimicrobiales bacterium]|nr:acyl-CoA thioesterase II [Acidimicrobiales bacterium]
MTAALDALVSLLDLEPIEVNLFRGVSPDERRQRVFGGQVAGQALVAAGRTVDPARAVHSLHAYFLRPGDPEAPILYQVDRIRDGRSFTTRRVVAIQHGVAIFNLSASFQVAESGLDHQVPMPDAPRPETLPTFAEALAPWRHELGDWYHRPRPIDQRFVDEPSTAARVGRPARQQVWMRADGALPDDPLLHACVVAYASDMSLLDSVVLPHGLSWADPRVQGASLDHAMWFHRPFRADAWMLYDQESPSASGARGLARASIFTADGHLGASVVQEGLVRLIAGQR